jgi:DNA-binding response OmpR family regulator
MLHVNTERGLAESALAVADHRSSRLSASARGHAINSPGTVLVIDDDDEITKVFARMLYLEGFQVWTAHSAEKGLQVVEDARPDAIILDLRMPVIDGLGFLYRLRMREHGRNTPVAIVTGDYTVEDLMGDEITDLGAQFHFKPLWLDDLLAVALALVGTEPRLTGGRPSMRH